MMYKEYETYSDRALIERVWDIEDVKDTMSRRVYLSAANRRSEELDWLWVSHPENMRTASFGRNWGYYVGMDSIRRYYVDAHNQRERARLQSIGRSEAGYGSMSQHPVTTGLVELALDGQTARGLWYSLMGQEASAGPNGADARWYNEKIAADFIREDGQWKIWHLVIVTDYTAVPGSDQNAIDCLTDTDLVPVREEFGTPDITLLTHDRNFNWWDNYPPAPEPYEHFSPASSYGPEGHPALREKVIQP